MATGPKPNTQTVEALLDTTWRIAEGEKGRTDGLDRKAASLATFSSLLTSLTATLGVTSVDQANALWALVLFWLGLLALLASVALAIVALLPTKYETLDMAYLRRFSKWGEILKPPEQVRGETMRGLIQAVARERRVNDRKTETVRIAFLSLLLGLLLIVAEAAILAGRSVFT